MDIKYLAALWQNQIVKMERITVVQIQNCTGTVQRRTDVALISPPNPHKPRKFVVRTTTSSSAQKMMMLIAISQGVLVILDQLEKEIVTT